MFVCGFCDKRLRWDRGGGGGNGVYIVVCGREVNVHDTMLSLTCYGFVEINDHLSLIPMLAGVKWKVESRIARRCMPVATCSTHRHVS